jgi:hypothetical protein
MSQPIPNIRYSRNLKKYGPPPTKVVVGNRRWFFDPKALALGVYLPPADVKLLTDNVGGFKKIIKKGRK